jgi:hypothetical protein
MDQKFDYNLKMIEKLLEEVRVTYTVEHNHDGKKKCADIISDIMFYLKEGKRKLAAEARKLPKQKVVNFKPPKEQKNKANEEL